MDQKQFFEKYGEERLKIVGESDDNITVEMHYQMIKNRLVDEVGVNVISVGVVANLVDK